MTGSHDFYRPVTDADRAVYEKWRPIVEEMDARRHRWMATNRRPDERIDQALTRYREICAAARRTELSDVARRLVRRRPSPRLVWLNPTAAESEATDALDRSAAHLVKD